MSKQYKEDQAQFHWIRFINTGIQPVIPAYILKLCQRSNLIIALNSQGIPSQHKQSKISLNKNRVG